MIFDEARYRWRFIPFSVRIILVKVWMKFSCLFYLPVTVWDRAWHCLWHCLRHDEFEILYSGADCGLSQGKSARRRRNILAVVAHCRGKLCQMRDLNFFKLKRNQLPVHCVPQVLPWTGIYGFCWLQSRIGELPCQDWCEGHRSWHSQVSTRTIIQ